MTFYYHQRKPDCKKSQPLFGQYVCISLHQSEDDRTLTLTISHSNFEKHPSVVKTLAI